MSDPLEAFVPDIRAWFTRALGAPTPPQRQGWPAIQRGEHTLILAPTGSGKTLTAFLWGIDELLRAKAAARDEAAGVRVVYVSPLKALNNDVERNLREPLDGIRAEAALRGAPAPAIRVAVRTGDTPAAARASMLKRPPDILITTPESLYLLLTSPRARAMFRSVRTVIVDEIHTLIANKRGVHLSLTLERLEHAAGHPIQRIGLSATVRPAEEAARFLGGNAAGQADRPRDVKIVDAHYRKALDLQVITAVEDFAALPAGSIWPSVIPRVLADIYAHRSTLVFANNRRLAERTADRLNAQLEAERSEEVEPGSTAALAPGGIQRDRGMFAIGASGPIRAHHGSMSKEARRDMEESLKAGRLPALVGTSSLELGIDIGAVDLVVQLQSPKSVAQGLQRVGRSGHRVGEVSRGRIYPTFREDLLESAAIARGMLDGDVELTYTPRNALDVLAQQVVAAVAVEDWPASDLLSLIRQSYAYSDLSDTSFRSVLAMLSGAYYVDATDARAASALRAKIAWDRVNDRLSALPGSRLVAMSNVGTIPDTGAYGAYLGDNTTKVGELDEEFVLETRVGDTFLLGSRVWRVTDIRDDRVILDDAAGATPRMPFWRGDTPYRAFELGERIGAFRREVTARVLEAGADPGAEADVLAWLRNDYALDQPSARNALDHVRRQLEAVGVMSSDRAIVVEMFDNDVGDPFVVVHSPFGGRVNAAWALALGNAIADATGLAPESQVNDDGILFRIRPESRRRVADLVAALGPAESRERILRQLPGSAVFGARFRMNAARALLLTKAGGRKRTPFWLQRLRAKDLLALVSKLDDFPIVVETYRDCLSDVLDLPHLEHVLARVQSGDIRIVPVETAAPSPIAAGLLFYFTSQYLYEGDAPKAERDLQALSAPRAALADLMGSKEFSALLKPEAIADVRAWSSHLAKETQARSAEELALALRELGDATDEEVDRLAVRDGAVWIETLHGQGRVRRVDTGRGERWAPAELADEYAALARTGQSEPVLRRFLRHAGPVSLADILARYGFGPAWLAEAIDRLVARGALVRGRLTSADADEVCDAPTLERIRRRTLALLRKEVQPVEARRYTDFLAAWHGTDRRAERCDVAATRAAVHQLRGLALPAAVWERDVLPARLAGYDRGLDVLSAAGELVWVADGREPRRAALRLFLRGEGGLFLSPPTAQVSSDAATAVLEFLKAEGASHERDVAAGTGLRGDALAGALRELALASWITHDAFDAYRKWMDEPAGEPRVRGDREPSPLERELARRMPPDHAARPTRDRMRDARRRVGERLFRETLAANEAVGGRWQLVHRPGILGRALSADERAEGIARVLLDRYGVVAREMLDGESLISDWGGIYRALERMEMRGDARRGLFIAGLSGAQFALPGAVERLRARAGQEPQDAPITVLSAVDPILALRRGDAGSGLGFNRVPSTHVALRVGDVAAVFEDLGERIALAPSLAPGEARDIVAAYFSRPNRPRRNAVSTWNGRPVLDTDGRDVLKALGFDRVPGGMERWSSDD